MSAARCPFPPPPPRVDGQARGSIAGDGERAGLDAGEGAGRGSSLATALGGNSDPVFCVLSGLGSY